MYQVPVSTRSPMRSLLRWAAGIVLLISGPSMLLAWLKLRQRSLGPILDASGWAINGRMKINLQLGNSLSQAAKVPLSAKRITHDPFADKHTARWVWGVVAVLVLAVVLGVSASVFVVREQELALLRTLRNQAVLAIKQAG